MNSRPGPAAASPLPMVGRGATGHESEAPPLEIWGGIECTQNRVGDRTFDQLALSGHATRPGDIRRLAALGLRTLRYPVPWAQVAPRGRADWGWTDERLGLLRDASIRPIVGFVHGGAAPAGTTLLEWDFAPRLADFGAAFAERYPWVQWFAPINQPVTTARFSALYGHWQPHHRDDASFVRALLVQCLAVQRTMRAIRAVRPGARLLQTEDVGRVYGSRAVRGQVAFENQRRWLTFDLLSGRVDDDHPLAAYLRRHGAERLDVLLDRPCPPDLLGVNFYVTSDRLLDEQWTRHPDQARGGNGALVYADVAAVRSGARDAGSHGRIMREVWGRYGRPMALSEVHLGGHREDQVRWLAQAWNAAEQARRHGADVRAITAWSLFGAFGWDRLVTVPPGASYEPGAYDVRGSGLKTPRPTALAVAITDLVHHRAIRHPVVARATGWWIRAGTGPQRRAAGTLGQPMLVVGSGGALGSAVRRSAAARGLALVGYTHAELDAGNAAALARAIERTRPWVVINAAGFRDVDEAEVDPVRCRRANVDVPFALTRACQEAGLPLVTFSSNQVFDGAAGAPYGEGAPLAPLNAYGRANARAEQWVRALGDRALIVRTSALFGPWDGHNVAAAVLAHARAGRELRLASDVTVSATYLPDLVDAVLDLAIDGASGTWHLTSSPPMSWSELGARIALRAGVDSAMVVPTPAARMPWRAVRPAYSALTSHRANLLPGFDSALDRFAAALGELAAGVAAVHAGA